MQNKSTGGFWSDNKFTFKGILIGVLIILMLIPTLYIMGLIDERAKRKQEVVKDISSKWATEQTFTGPFLIIPYLDDSPGANSTASKKYAYFLPAELNIQAELSPQTREKSIYKVVVYKAGMQVNGHFSALAGDPVANSTSLLLQEAQLCLGIDDFTGIEDQLIVQWNGHPLTLNAGIPDTHILKHGLSTQIALTEDDLNNNLSFSINVQLS